MLMVLTILSIIVILAFFTVLIVYLIQIASTLERIGGKSSSYLNRLDVGLLAIEQETGLLPEAIVEINRSLTAIEGSLVKVDEQLSVEVDAVILQEKK